MQTKLIVIHYVEVDCKIYRKNTLNCFRTHESRPVMVENLFVCLFVCFCCFCFVLRCDIDIKYGGILDPWCSRQFLHQARHAHDRIGFGFFLKLGMRSAPEVMYTFMKSAKWCWHELLVAFNDTALINFCLDRSVYPQTLWVLVLLVIRGF